MGYVSNRLFSDGRVFEVNGSNLLLAVSAIGYEGA